MPPETKNINKSSTMVLVEKWRQKPSGILRKQLNHHRLADLKQLETSRRLQHVANNNRLCNPLMYVCTQSSHVCLSLAAKPLIASPASGALQLDWYHVNMLQTVQSLGAMQNNFDHDNFFTHWTLVIDADVLATCFAASVHARPQQIAALRSSVAT